MKIELDKNEVKAIQRGLIMIDKSLGRKALQEDISEEMTRVIKHEKAYIQALSTKLENAELPLNDTTAKTK